MKNKRTNQLIFGLLAVIVVLTMVGGMLLSIFLPSPNNTAASSQSTSQGVTAQDQQKIGELQQVLKGNPQDKNALLDLGELYLATEQYQLAADSFNKVLELDANNTDALMQLGVCDLYLGPISSAVEQFNKVLVSQPDNIEAHFYLGLALANSNPPDKEGAIAEFQTVKKLDTSGQLSSIVDKNIQSLQSAQ